MKKTNNQPRGLLVSGLQRSGTTWTAKMITLSSEIFYIPEPFNILRDPIHLMHAGTNFPFFPAPDQELFHKIRSGIGLSFTGEELKIFLKQSSSPKYHLYHLVRYVTLKNRLKKNMRPVVQDPFAIFMAPWLYEQFEMQMLFLFRHPAAYISSMKRMKWGFNFDWLAKQEALLEGALVDFKEDILRFAPQKFVPFSIETQALVWNIFTSAMLNYRKQHPEWMFYRHEDLSLKTLQSFKKIYQDMGLDYNSLIVEKIKKFTESNNPTEAKDGQLHTLKRNSRDNVKIWQKRLNPDEIKQIRTLTEAVSDLLYFNDDWT